MCGGTSPSPMCRLRTRGLSPRVRGNLARAGGRSHQPGSIPACAGEPAAKQTGYGAAQVYPRVCGGTPRRAAAPGQGMGLSPRVRGNQRPNEPLQIQAGSIPACAGEPRAGRAATPIRWVYPRVCGGTYWQPSHPAEWEGLSPRVRGNRNSAGASATATGSIPACAGEPRVLSSSLWRPAVYPRVCGGTWAAAVRADTCAGLSPRVRGNPATASIAADSRGVYPRVCGGTPDFRPGRRAENGLSPRVRGNPATASIAADSRGVYPRVCGGTTGILAIVDADSGLSPRVRGNPTPCPPAAASNWSIPACAGEPDALSPSRSVKLVYPRVCGGTAVTPAGATVREGLSPRVRGNLDDALASTRDRGSIPACAGEPRSPGSTLSSTSGLSPRVRGNRRGDAGRRQRQGSIPACAGEPRVHRLTRRPIRVYPRVCGGTHRPAVDAGVGLGLSPRVRGNRGQRRYRYAQPGSIPACAGEPPAGNRGRRPAGVYPRVCGGTRR